MSYNSKYKSSKIEEILDSVEGKQDRLVSGTNIKTINGESIVGSGDLTIEGGAKIYTWSPTITSTEDEDTQISGTFTEEEYYNILNADVLYINVDGAPIFCIARGINSENGEGIHITGSQIRTYANFAIDIFVIKEDGVFTGTISEPIPSKTSQLENDSNFITSDGLKTINGETILGSGDISISGGSGGEDIRYFTEFTVEDFIEASATNSSVMGSASKLKIAAANNNLICIPYENADTGYVIASYSYKDYSDYSDVEIRLEYNGNVYMLHETENDLLLADYPINLSGGIVELQLGLYPQIEVKDNTLYSLSVEEELIELVVGVFDILHKGSTIRFFSSHAVDAYGGMQPMTLSLVGTEVLWPNGVMPEIEIDTWYELSLTTSGDGSYCLAVLTPFKSVE